MIKIIVFDFDGTIADTYPSSRTVLRKLAPKYGYKLLTNKESDVLRDHTLKEVFKMSGLSWYKLPFIVRDAKKEINRYMGSLKPIPGMKEVLLKLRQKGFHLALITSNNKNNVKLFLHRNKLDIFETLHTGTTVFGKARVIKGFLKKNNVNKSEIVYVGDEIRDIDAAKKVGVPLVSVTWGFNSKKGLQRFHPEFLVETPKDLFPLLEKIIQKD